MRNLLSFHKKIAKIFFILLFFQKNVDESFKFFLNMDENEKNKLQSKLWWNKHLLNLFFYDNF